jgi:hypothetical protein
MPAIQNYAKHRQYVIGYHYVLSALIVIVLGWAVVGFIRYPAVANFMPIVTAITLVLLYWYARAFAVRVQDRVIRLEERLRMTGLLPNDLMARFDELRVHHLVALRFASDAEVPELVRRVLTKELDSPDDIKRAIVTWRPDYVRA